MPRLALLLIAVPCAMASVTTPSEAQGVFHGRQSQLSARIPRSDAEVVIDGKLDEPIWRDAALLTGFSDYLPLDQRPASDSTDVLVWYSTSAVYFGIRAYEIHGPVHATLAARDHIDSDDYVQLLIDPFDDRRRAFVFGVNALGVQADGMRSEGGIGSPSARGQTFGGSPPINFDLNPDFVYESKGHVTENGYEIEARIPLKSIRFQGRDEQQWAIQVLRYVQHSGYQQTWTPARRGSASFLGQSGTLHGISGLRRDAVVELNPELTASRSGVLLPATSASTAQWSYDSTAALGGNVRWRVVPNVTLNATIRPDFSQVEADAAQIPGDTRFALFFPEKRPFFVDGIEQFDSPSNLIYTRRVVHPDAALKLSGKTGRTNFALLSAIDDRDASATGTHHPVFNILRVRRDLQAASTAGLTYTDRVEGSDYNRVLSADTRIVFRREYTFSTTAAVSGTSAAGVSHTSPLWDINFNKTGYRYGFLAGLSGVDPNFVAASGFVPRTDFVRGSFYNRVSFYGRRGSFLESWLIREGLEGLWLYDAFLHGGGVQETKVQLENVINLRGGWVISLTPVHESFLFDPRSYMRYAILRPVAGGAAPPDTVALSPSPRTPTFVALIRVNTPAYRFFSGRFTGIIGRDIDFFETAPAHRTDLTADVDFRPSGQLRLTTSYLYSVYTRWRDNATFSRANVPRLKVEYQLNRALFVRFVGQYDNRTRDALRDPATDYPLAIKSGGSYALAGKQATRDLRVDWLMSFVPSPGTVVFAGYGASLTEPEAFRFADLHRVRDGFFLKLSYLLRR